MEFKFFENHEVKEEDLEVLIDLTNDLKIQWVEGPEYYTFHARPKGVLINKRKDQIVSRVPKEIIVACEPDLKWRAIKFVDEKGWSYSIEKLSNSELIPMINELYKAVIYQAAL